MNPEIDFAAQVERAIEKRASHREVEASKAQIAEEIAADRYSFWEGVYSHEGLALQYASALTPQTRRALAGLISSMIGNSIEPNRYIRASISRDDLVRARFLTPKIISYFDTKQEIEGWMIGSEYPSLDGNTRSTDDLYISTDYRLYSIYEGEQKRPLGTRRALNEGLMQSGVIAILSEADAPWIEPPADKWE